jgi:hypothetical protein
VRDVGIHFCFSLSESFGQRETIFVWLQTAGQHKVLLLFAPLEEPFVLVYHELM